MNRIQKSEYAPKYHFYSIHSWHEARATFDPNGCIYWKGRHHLFYIFQDLELPHGGHCWGHASSVDLINWEFHPPALVPAPGDPEKGIFSGCALINKEGVPTLVYFGIDAGCCIATAQDDELINWKKSPHNPIVPIKRGESEDKVYNVFDPHVWVDGDYYIGVFGAVMRPYMRYDTAYMWRSKDLLNWEYLRPFYIPSPEWTQSYEDMACPDFFKLGEKHILLGISHTLGARYYVGDYISGTFVPESHHRLNYPGGSLFAPESYVDGSGRRIAWFWMMNQRRGVKQEAGNQIMALPRVMTWNAEQSEVNWSVPEEYVGLREKMQSFNDITVSGNYESWLAESVQGDSMELQVEVSEIGDKFELLVLVAPDEMEYTKIIVDSNDGTLSIDSSCMGSRAMVDNFYPVCMRAGYDKESERIDVQKAPFELRDGEKLHLQVFVDRCIVEVFVNQRFALSQCVYPLGDECKGVLIRSDKEISVDSLKCWQMKGLESSMK